MPDNYFDQILKFTGMDEDLDGNIKYEGTNSYRALSPSFTDRYFGFITNMATGRLFLSLRIERDQTA